MNEKQVTLITLIVLAVIVVVGGAAIYLLKFKTIKQKDLDIANLKKGIADDEKSKAAIKKLQDDFVGLEKQEKEKEQRIPKLDIEEYDRFIDTIESMRQQAGVAIGGAKLLPQRIGGGPQAGPRLPPNIHKVTYEFAIAGGFFQLLRFLNLVEQQSRFMRVDTFQISAGGGGALSKLLSSIRTMKVQIYTYTYRVEAKPGDKPEEKKEEVTSPSTPLPD